MASIRLSVFNDSTFNLQNAVSEAREVGASSRSLLERSLQFRRAEEIYPNFQANLFTNINPHAIQPNPLIREYTFWRVLKHLATAPELVRSLFVKLDDNRRGQFSVYVTREDRAAQRAEDKKTEIEIDTVIPVIKIGENQYQPAFCQIVGNDIWPLLFEKAVMKAFRSLSLMMSKSGSRSRRLHDSVHHYRPSLVQKARCTTRLRFRSKRHLRFQPCIFVLL